MWLMFSPSGWVNIDNLKKGMWLVEDPTSILLEGVISETATSRNSRSCSRTPTVSLH